MLKEKRRAFSKHRQKLDETMTLRQTLDTFTNKFIEKTMKKLTSTIDVSLLLVGSLDARPGGTW
jgi:hypothetical protein